MSTFAKIKSRAGRALLQAVSGPRLADSVKHTTTDTGVLDEHSQQGLWLRELYTGILGFAGGGAAILYYVFRNWDTGPNRVWLALVGSFAIAQALAVWSARRHFVTATQRGSLFIGCTVAAYALIATASALDGGIGSPISSLWVLPTIYLSMGFSRAAIVFCGSIAIVLYFVVAWLMPGNPNSGAFTMELVVLVVAVFMVLLGATAREERERVLAAVRSQLSVLATIDGLTGCINPQAFAQVAAIEVARAARYKHEISMLALDVDHFKFINDEHGHLMGDEVLRQLGATLRACVRGTDIVARIGGDELLVLCPETGESSAIRLAERLRASVRQLRVPFNVTLSIGICTLGIETSDLQQLRECADLALYEAKQQGRDRYAVFTLPGAVQPRSRTIEAETGNG